MSDVALRLENVSKAYGSEDHKVVVLSGADLTIKSGEMVALVAPSGTGKSTLLHSAGLLERPDSGEVFIDGRATMDLEDRQRTQLRRNSIGFIYQFHHLLPEFDARENLMIPQLVQGRSKSQAVERANELLSFMKLEHRAGHRPSELSGGEQQRVAIARAVANGPKVLLADEPTGNLDPETSEHVFATLSSLVRQTGLAALIVTHNHGLAGQMDRRVTLESGQVAEI